MIHFNNEPETPCIMIIVREAFDYILILLLYFRHNPLLASWLLISMINKEYSEGEKIKIYFNISLGAPNQVMVATN